jgi:hypothetical protein
MFSERYGQLAAYLAPHQGSLLGLDFGALVNAGVAPADLFRLLHHPWQKFEELAQVAMEFRQGEPLDYLLLSQ